MFCALVGNLQVSTRANIGGCFSSPVGNNGRDNRRWNNCPILLEDDLGCNDLVEIGVVSSPNFLLQFPSPSCPPFSLSFLLVSPKSHHLSFPPLSSLVLVVPLKFSGVGCGYKEKVPISEYGPYWVPILCVKLAVTLQAMVACFKPMMAGRIRYGLWWKHFYSLQ